MSMKKPRLVTILIGSLCAGLLLCGCVKKLAMNAVIGSLTGEGGGTVFTGDDDPELVGDALPFALKMYESLLESAPDNPKLLLATGKGFCMYAYAFVCAPADMLPDSRIDEQKAQHKRGKKLFLRGRDYVLRGLDVLHPGFKDYLSRNRLDSALALTTPADTSYLYWAGASWMGAFTTDKFDMGLMMGTTKAIGMIKRALAYNESFGEGGLHEFFISYYGGIPESMGGSDKLAREHFARALELSGGAKAGPYVSLATALSIKNHDVAEFRDLLGKALAVDLNASPGNRLANVLSQRKAQWLLDHLDQYFLLPEEGEPADSTQTGGNAPQ